MENEDEARKQIAQLEALVKQKLTREALMRLGNIKAAHHERFIQLLVVIGQLIQAGEVDTIDDSMLKDLLRRMAAGKRDIQIRKV